MSTALGLRPSPVPNPVISAAGSHPEPSKSKKTPSRSGSASLQTPYRLSTNDKENMGTHEHAGAHSGLTFSVKSAQGHEETPPVSDNDVRPRMAPMILFPSEMRSQEASAHNVHAIQAGDLEVLGAKLPSGGCLLTIHDPVDASAWIDSNFNHQSLLDPLRERGLSGPVAAMLDAYTQCLIFFRSLEAEEDSSVVACAEEVANYSGFPVVIRPDVEDPLARFAHAKSIVSEKAMSLSNSNPGAESNRIGSFGGEGDTNGEPHDSGSGHGDDTNGDSHGGENGKENGGGGGDRGKPKSESADAHPNGGHKTWECLTHSILAACKLKISPTSTYDFSVNSRFRFAAPVPVDIKDLRDRNAMFESLNQGDIEAFTKLEVGTNGSQLLVDATYASLGFEGHQPQSFHSCKYISGGNDPPKQIHTQTAQKHTGTSLSGTIGNQGAVLGLQRSRGHSHSIEATGDTYAPDWIVRQQLGNRFNSNEQRKSYMSIATTYEPQINQFEALPKPLDVNVGLALELRANQDVRVSFVNRTQIHVWISQPDSKSLARGVIFLLCNYLPDIHTEHALKITEDDFCIDISNSAETSPGPSPSSESEKHENVPSPRSWTFLPPRFRNSI
ncbi:hypothetical protein FB45DRAFT_124215 [Roridomyces roridus]|uniref:Uncharacterized protein n=1 Tax=Roridomyces roridus TaxID=1738132 RepID=A0AAD7BIL9_9AGAR|nr:hypothetical protein FB45DRAFT_124215 [Roridomyces roridus]